MTTARPATFLDSPPQLLRSVHTTTLPRLLSELGLSVLVSTYQAGKLVVLRADEGRLNSHFRAFARPMGLAADGGRLAVGTAMTIDEFLDVPAAARRIDMIDMPGKYDGCFLQRLSHVTGDIRVHEMAWAGDELWFVNTAFSCLCTLGGAAFSFVPRWLPPFISALAPEDRCHLNGLGLRDGAPRYVTALGEADTPGGWRANKRDGGIVVDVQTGRVLARGLSMPHSPRWHDGRVWVLESGTGGLGTVDPDTGRYESVATLPGFTRGLDFAGPFAFVGLSQVRETAVFGGLPITASLAERSCGLWVVDTRDGRTVGFLKFEDAVQEVFAVQLLHGLRFPDVVNDDPRLLATTYILPDDALAGVSPPMATPHLP